MLSLNIDVDEDGVFLMVSENLYDGLRHKHGQQGLDANSTTTIADQVLDIPVTPPGDVRNNAYNSTVGSYFSPNVLTAMIITSWYFSNIGVLLLNKYLFSFYGYRYPIFLTMLHMISCTCYSYGAIKFLEIIPLQHILSRKQFLKIFALSAFFLFLYCLWEYFFKVLAYFF